MGRSIDKRQLEKNIKDLMETLRLDLRNPNFKETPERVARAWIEFRRGLTYPNLKVFPSKMSQMVLLKNYKCFGFCPHHLLPVEYTIKLGYIPNGFVIGLSKLARLVDYHLQSFPLQEDLAEILVEDLNEAIKPLGSGCTIVGKHMCVMMRGVKGREAEFVTTRLKGMILINPAPHEEFINA